MIICGISMDSNNANLCVIKTSGSEYEVISTNVKKISLTDDSVQNNVKLFQKSFQTFVQENNIELIGIKARLQKGKFAGGSVSFKMESIIQLTDKEVQIIPSRTIGLKTKKIDIPDKLFKYQVEAFKTAYTLMIIKLK